VGVGIAVGVEGKLGDGEVGGGVGVWWEWEKEE